MSAHPVRAFFDAGVIVCVSCDNRTASDITLTGECANAPSVTLSELRVAQI
jgi:adenosine deaminase